MPELFSDDNGNRVIVRHKGPAGKGFPPGGTTGQILSKTSTSDFDAGWVNPPDGTDAVVFAAGYPIALPEDLEVVIFSGTTGKIVKSSGVLLGELASVSSVNTKVDKVAGKGLSTEDYSSTEKTRLARSWNGAGYRGSFSSLGVIEAHVFSPLPAAGDYCLIEVAAEDVQEVLWDATNSVWLVQSTSAVNMTGAEIAAVLFDSGDVWDVDTCRIFTETEKNQLANHETLINALGGLSAATPFGGIGYFSIVGAPVAIAAASSDGVSNMVKVDLPTTVLGTSVSFDNGGASNGRLRYTGNTERKFHVSARISYNGTAGDVVVLGIFKNGSLDALSRSLSSVEQPANISSVSINAVITLTLNDYIELFIGNVTGTDDFTVHVLAVEAVPV